MSEKDVNSSSSDSEESVKTASVEMPKVSKPSIDLVEPALVQSYSKRSRQSTSDAVEEAVPAQDTSEQVMSPAVHSAGMHAVNACRPAPLADYNSFKLWYARMKLFLKTHGLWTIIETGLPRNPTSSQVGQNDAAMTVILSSVEGEIAHMVSELKVAKEAIDKIGFQASRASEK